MPDRRWSARPRSPTCTRPGRTRSRSSGSPSCTSGSGSSNARPPPKPTSSGATPLNWSSGCGPRAAGSTPTRSAPRRPTRRPCSPPARRSKRCASAASRWRARPATTPNGHARWASACSTRSRSLPGGPRQSSASNGSRSSTGTCTTGTERRTSSPTTRRSSSSRCTSGRSTPAPAARPSRARRWSTCPLAAGSGDAEYFEAWETVERAVTGFEPDLLLVSAGFDAHTDDPLADMRLSADGFRRARPTRRDTRPTRRRSARRRLQPAHAARPGRGCARRVVELLKVSDTKRCLTRP